MAAGAGSSGRARYHCRRSWDFQVLKLSSCDERQFGQGRWADSPQGFGGLEWEEGRSQAALRRSKERRNDVGRQIRLAELGSFYTNNKNDNKTQPSCFLLIKNRLSRRENCALSLSPPGPFG